MVLPLVVFWRLYLKCPQSFRRYLLGATAAAGLIAFWLSLPTHFRLANSEREVGQQLDYRVGDNDAHFQEAMSHASILFSFFPPVEAVNDPRRVWAMEHITVLHYALLPKPPGATVNYIVQPKAAAPPPGFTFIAT